MKLEDWLLKQLGNGRIVVRARMKRDTFQDHANPHLHIYLYGIVPRHGGGDWDIDRIGIIHYEVDTAPVPDWMPEGSEIPCIEARRFAHSSLAGQAAILVEDWPKPWRMQKQGVFIDSSEHPWPLANRYLSRHLSRLQGALEVFRAKGEHTDQNLLASKVSVQLNGFLNDCEREADALMTAPK